VLGNSLKKKNRGP